MLSTIEQAIEDFRAGKMIIIVDDEDRENEGDLTCAAELVTPEIINFMAREGRGLICLPLSEERCDELELPLQVSERQNSSGFGTAFTVSIEAMHGVTTGISAADRAHTIKTASSPDCTARDLARPGHVFPLRARKGGVLMRPGQTEASVDLARMAGLQPAAGGGKNKGVLQGRPILRAQVGVAKVLVGEVHLRVVAVDLVARRGGGSRQGERERGRKDEKFHGLLRIRRGRRLLRTPGAGNGASARRDRHGRG